MDKTKEQEKFRKQVQLLGEKINEDIYNQRKHFVGKILTVVDASFSDHEQRKAVKDIVNEIFYGPSYWNRISDWLEGFAKANGIEKLYDHTTLLTPPDVDDMSRHFEDIK